MEDDIIFLDIAHLGMFSEASLLFMHPGAYYQRRSYLLIHPAVDILPATTFDRLMKLIKAKDVVNS